MRIVKMIGLLGAVALSPLIHAQVGGISASKVGTFCAGTVPERDLEFEPSYSFSKSKRHWNANKQLVNTYSTSDSAEIASELAIRCTYGFSDKLEMGISVPSDVSEASLGAKYLAWSNSLSGFSLIAGVNLPMGNKVYSSQSHSLDDIGSLAAGLVFSHQFHEKLLWDIDVQGQTLLRDAGMNTHSDLFINTDLGFYPKEHIQLICGMGYCNHFYKDSENNTGMLDIHPGVSYETGENFLIVVSSSFGLLGKNEAQAWGINMAFTMTIR